MGFDFEIMYCVPMPALQGNVVEAPKEAKKIRDPVSDEALDKLKRTLSACQAAQRIYATYSQEQVRRKKETWPAWQQRIRKFRDIAKHYVHIMPDNVTMRNTHEAQSLLARVHAPMCCLRH